MRIYLKYIYEIRNFQHYSRVTSLVVCEKMPPLITLSVENQARQIILIFIEKMLLSDMQKRCGGRVQ